MLIRQDPLLRQRILKTAWPAVVEMVMYMIVGIVDVAVVGRLGASPLAAVSLGAEIFFGLVMCISALGTGSSVLLAQAKGGGRIEEASRIAGQTFGFGVVLGLVVLGAGLLAAPAILSLFPVEPVVRGQALGYLQAAFLASPFAVSLYMTNAVFRGMGRTDLPMVNALITIFVNSVLDVVFVYGLFGCPRLGVAGAAWATAVAHIVGFAIAVWFLFTGKAGVSTAWESIAHLRWSTLGGILSLGSMSMAEEVMRTGATLVSSFLLAFLGTVSFASHQVAVTVESLSFMPGYGFAIAAMVLVGNGIGARDRAAARRAARGSMEMAVLVMGVIGIIFLVLPRQTAMLFARDPAIVALAGNCLRIAALEQVTMALDMVLSGVLRGSGDTRTPMYISMGFTWLFRLPLMVLLIRVLHLSLPFIWALFVLDWFLRAGLYMWIYRRGRWLDRALS